MSRDQIKFGQIQYKIIILKLNQVKFKLKCVDSILAKRVKKVGDRMKEHKRTINNGYKQS